MQDTPFTASNRLIDALPHGERDRLLGHVKQVELPQSSVLARPDEELPAIVFPISGVVSLVTTTSEGGSIEAVLIGNEGVVGGWLAAGVDRAPWLTIVQAPGSAMLLEPAAFRHLLFELPTLALLVQRFNFAAHLLTAQSAACYRFHDLIARGARWLLMVSDRTGATELTLTQEFLSQMLGAHRPSVTVTLRTMQQAGLISLRRGGITILDREALTEISCECYQVVRDLNDRLLSVESRG